MANEKEPYAPCTCVVCSQPLPILRHDYEEAPTYFGGVSCGYKAGDEGIRACEDIEQLLRRTATVITQLWDCFSHRELAAKVNAINATELRMFDQYHYSESARDLWFLFSDLLEEAARRGKLLNTFIEAQFKKDNEVEGISHLE